MDSCLKTRDNTRAQSGGKRMNKKESGAARICNRTSTSVARALPLHRQAVCQLKQVATHTRQPSRLFLSNNHDRVRKGLTLVGISVNGSGVYPLDGLLLGDGLNPQEGV